MWYLFLWHCCSMHIIILYACLPISGVHLSSFFRTMQMASVKLKLCYLIIIIIIIYFCFFWRVNEWNLQKGKSIEGPLSCQNLVLTILPLLLFCGVGFFLTFLFFLEILIIMSQSSYSLWGVIDWIWAEQWSTRAWLRTSCLILDLNSIKFCFLSSSSTRYINWATRTHSMKSDKN